MAAAPERALVWPVMSLDSLTAAAEPVATRDFEDETWTDAVERFAASIYRDRSTVWRWLAGERRVPKSVWARLQAPEEKT